MEAKQTWQPPADGVEAKVVKSIEEAKARIDALNQAGQRVVFTNGAFDVLHVGHLRSLRQARALGDHLMVAVNSDRSVRQSKGPDRPLFPAQERIELLAGLACVDTVFVFDDATVDAVLLLLQPAVHAKGPDYTLETVPERQTVLSYGGEIAITGDPKDHSSSALQRRLRASP